jgi:hypothetical protein
MTLWMGYSQTPEIENGDPSGTPPFPRLYTCLVQSKTTSPLYGYGSGTLLLYSPRLLTRVHLSVYE